MKQELKSNNHVFKKMMIAVLLIIAAIFYTFFRIQNSGELLWQDNLIIGFFSISGIFLFLRAVNKDKYRLDKI